MAKEIERVYIKKPIGFTDKELREIIRKMGDRAKVTDKQVQFHVNKWNDNGIFNLGMKFQRALINYFVNKNE